MNRRGDDSNRRGSDQTRPENDSRPPRGANAETVSKWCDYCGGPVATEEWYPAATRHDEDGNVDIYGFCDEECREQWQSEEASD